MQKVIYREKISRPQHLDLKSLAAVAARDLKMGLQQRGKKLRRNQKSALLAFANRLEQGVTGDYVKRPTGAGKTGILGFFVKSMQGLMAEPSLPRDFLPNILLITPTMQLLEQIAEELSSPLIGFDPEEITLYNPDIHSKLEDDFSWLDAPVLGMTLAAYRNLWRDGFINPADRPFVILDEMDIARGPATDPAIKELLKKSIVFGATATDRFIHNGREITLGDYYFDGRPPCSGMTFRDGVNDGVLAPTKNVIFRINYNKPKHIDSIVNEDGEISIETRHAIVTQEGRDEAAIRAIATYDDAETGIALRNEKQVWYCDGIRHAEEITKRLNEIYDENYAVTVSGKMTRRQQRKILTDYRQGKYRAVVNADLLLRGFNDPEASVCVMLRQSRSGPLVEQAGGRVTRKNKKNKNKIAYVINFMDSTINNSGFAYYGRVVGGTFIAPLGYRPRYKREDSDFLANFGDVEAVAVAVPIKDVNAEFDAERSLDFGFDNIADLSNFIPKGFLTREDMVRKLGEQHYYDVERLYEAFQTNYREQRSNKDQSKKISIKWLKSEIALPLDAMRLCRFQGRPTFVLHDRFVVQFEDAIKRVTGKTNDQISTAEYFKLKGRKTEASVYAVYGAVERAWQSAMEKCGHKPSLDQCFYFSYKGRRFSFYINEAGYFKDENGRIPFCIDRKALERFMPDIIKSKRPQSMWTKGEFEKHLNIGYSQIEPHLDAMRLFYEHLRLEDRSDVTKTYTMKLGDHEFAIPATKMGLYGGGRHGEVFCLDQNYALLFGNELAKLRFNEDDFVILEDMKQIFGQDRGRARTVFNRMKTAWHSSKGKAFVVSLDDLNITFNPDDCRMVLGRKGAKNFAIKKKFVSSIQQFVEGTPIPPNENWLLIDAMVNRTDLNYNTVRKIYLFVRNAAADKKSLDEPYHTICYQDRKILIPTSAAATYKEPREKGSISLHMNSCVIPILKEAFPPRLKTKESDFDYKTMSDYVGLKRESMIGAYNAIRTAWLSHVSARAAAVAKNVDPDLLNPNSTLSVRCGDKSFIFNLADIGERINANDRIIFSVDKKYASQLHEMIVTQRRRPQGALTSFAAG